jgi:hypothetical protein
MAVLWTDGTWTSAEAVTNPEFESPIPGSSAAYVLRQDFVILLANWSALALDTAHGTYSDFKLVAEGPRVDLGGGVCRWTRTYAKVPATWDDWESYAYNFIGRTGTFGINIETVTGRERFTAVVPCRVRKEYFRCASGETYTTPGAIPVNRQLFYCYGNIGLPVDYLFDATAPTNANYSTMITDAATNGWSASVATQTIDTDGDVTMGTAGGQIIAEDSRIVRWMGNIWCRETRYVLAQ